MKEENALASAQGAPDEEMTLAVAAEIYEVATEELHLMLEALELHREPDPLAPVGSPLVRRMVRRGNEFETFYKSADIEEAIALNAATLLGHDGGYEIGELLEATDAPWWPEEGD